MTYVGKEGKDRIARAFGLMRDHLREIRDEENDLAEWAEVEWAEYAELADTLGLDADRVGLDVFTAEVDG